MGLRREQLENEADWRNSMLGQKSQHEDDLTSHWGDAASIAQQRADAAAATAAAAAKNADTKAALAGQGSAAPETQVVNGITYVATPTATGKAWRRVTPPKPAAASKQDDAKSAALRAIDQAEAARDKMGYGASTLGALPGLFKNALMSHVEGTDANDFKDASLPAAAAAVKGVAGRTNWPEIEAAMGAMGSMGGTKEFNHQQFDRWRKIVGGADSASASAPAAVPAAAAAAGGAPAHPVFADPRAAAIKAQVAAGKLSLEQARQQLMALGGSGG
jgi:hypothetical protein